MTGTCQLIVPGLGLIKRGAGRRAAQTCAQTQVRLADRDARHGAHFPRAALLSGVVSVGPEGRHPVH